MDEKKYTAIVFGASGLTGHFVTELLIADPRYNHIKLFVRKELNFPSDKVKQYVFNSDKLDVVTSEVTGNHLFCCLGTTIKKAGSREVFFKTDHGLVERIAQIASFNKVESFVVISSLGANDHSRNFYLNTKGKMEESIKTFSFNNLSIVRPSMLMGIRRERRPLEEVSKVLSKVVIPFMVGSMRKYRPIHAEIVARAMIKLANKPKGTYTLESDKIEQLVND